MATYSIDTYQTLNLPAVTADTYFKVYDRSTFYPATSTTGLIYTGLVTTGYGIKNLNEVLAPYVKVETASFEFADDSQLIQDDEQLAAFYIYYTEQGDFSDTRSDVIYMTYNWSYEPIPKDNIRSLRPINLLDYRQILPFTIRDTSTGSTYEEYVITLQNSPVDSFQTDSGSIYTYMLHLNTLQYAGAFNYAYSYAFDVNRPYLLPGTYNTIKITWQGWGKNTPTYYVTNTCYNYAMYFLNSIGGWDYMLFGGRELQNDKLSRLSYKKDYVVGAQNFANVDYTTFINEAWELNTTYMNDLSSSKMIELLASNRIFLHDLNTQVIKPVNITNSSCEHKTYKNQGRKLYTYKITVSASQPKFRI